MDVAADLRTREAWLAAQRRSGRIASLSTGNVWRRLLAELESDEHVEHLDQLPSLYDDMFVAVTPTRVLFWTTMSDTMRRLNRAHVRIAEHNAAKQMLRLADGSGTRPVRVVGYADQKHALLAALGLPRTAPPAPAVVDISTNKRTEHAWRHSPAKPDQTGPLAERLVRELGRRAADCLAAVTATVSMGSTRTAGAIIAVAGKNVLLVPEPDSGLPNMIYLRAKVQLRADGWLTTVPTVLEPARELVHLRGSPAALQAVRDAITSWQSVMAAPTWRTFEAQAQALMVAMGFTDAALTGAGADEGIDVRSASAVAQAKFHLSRAGRPAVQQLHGVAAVQGKQGLFFSRSGYTAEAITWSTGAGLALFTVGDDFVVVPETPAATRLWSARRNKDPKLPTQPPPATTARGAGTASVKVGDPVTIRALGHRGKTGKVTKIGLFGATVQLDRKGGVVRAIPLDKLERVSRKPAVAPPATPAPVPHVAAGVRVVVKCLGYRGQTGTVTRVTRFGATVELDRGGKLRALGPKDYDPA